MSDKASVGEIIADVYVKLDAHMNGILETKFKASCKKGCAHCCHLMATITFGEAVLISETLLVDDAKWKAYLPKLIEAAHRYQYPGINRLNYLKKEHPCAFLGADNLCTIYEVRPACCRYHVVSTEPEKCSPRAPPDTKTVGLDLTQLEAFVWNISDEITQELKLDILMVGPLPIMVLACMAFMATGEEQKFIVRSCKGIDLPGVWMEKYMPGMQEEIDGSHPVRMSLEEAEARGLK